MPKTSAATDRGAVQAILRDKRAALRPADYRLPRPVGKGRRSAGPSQVQIDKILHWTPGTYQGIESGRVGDVSAKRLEELGRLLRLTEHEWEMLWATIRGEEPPKPLNDCAGLEVPGEWGVMLPLMQMAAYVNDRAWNVVDYNDHAVEFFGGRMPANTMRWMLFDPQARGDDNGSEGMLTDWEHAWAPFIVPQLRSAVAALPDDPTLAAIEAEVRADKRVAPIYDEFGAVYVHPDGAIRRVDHPKYGPGWARLCAAEPLAAPRAHLTLIHYTPGPTPPARRAVLRASSTPVCDVHAGQPLHAL